MLFVDGENLAMGAHRFSKEQDFAMSDPRFYEPTVFAWFRKGGSPRMEVSGDHTEDLGQAIRAYYYTSVRGDRDRRRDVQEALQRLGFAPRVFPRPVRFQPVEQEGELLPPETLAALAEKLPPHVMEALRVTLTYGRDQRSKQIDLAMATDILLHAYQDHYDTAILMTGDSDYIPVIEAVQRAGKRVLLQYFSSALEKERGRDLRLAADRFYDIGPLFKASWAPRASS